jgi:Lrp/AsnC family transcriptional regulator, leucine-responsive regulatory protein
VASEEKRMIDATDREILKILQQNGRISNAEIARQIGMAPSAILERIRKLEARKVIQGYEARIDPEALGLHLLAFIFVRSSDSRGECQTAERLAEIEEVQEVHHIAGEDCFLVKVRVRDARALGRLLRERIAAAAGVVYTRTTIVLETLQETTRLPIGAALPDDAAAHPGSAVDAFAAGDALVISPENHLDPFPAAAAAAEEVSRGH